MTRITELFVFQNKIEHTFEIKHPGKGENNVETVILTEIRDENDKFPVEYYMDVESVICYENLCKIVPVRIFWNVMGEYQRYKMINGAALEKYEGEPYTKEDYEKTHQILKNINSPFKTVRIDEILTTVKSHDIVDAVAGETLLEMDEEDTVHGASLTCYTLWHWTHGDIVSKIRDLTGNSFQTKQFERYLTSKKTDQQLFAIEQMTRIMLYNDVLRETLITQVISNNALLLKTLHYVEKTNSSDYFSIVKTLFFKGNKQIRIAMLNSLLKTKHEITTAYFEEFCLNLPNLSSYQEIALFLRLRSQRNLNSKKITDAFLPLLERDLLIARNAYWFLKTQELNHEQQSILNRFFEKYKEQL
ncbi:hypothetical protein [Aquimarina algicola]|uniref:Uncharacterized protein n=1 Tax=Aquimarina algicola TaxID=2589995 RepID=A0A504JIB7_9FLAO|nr:hypothetical protein [Aquimarina algicola]TPN86231.1 hypothetical protein FHK87_13260 [Aquimarina algicola]